MEPPLRSMARVDRTSGHSERPPSAGIPASRPPSCAPVACAPTASSGNQSPGLLSDPSCHAGRESTAQHGFAKYRIACRIPTRPAPLMRAASQIARIGSPLRVSRDVPSTPARSAITIAWSGQAAARTSITGGIGSPCTCPTSTAPSACTQTSSLTTSRALAIQVPDDRFEAETASRRRTCMVTGLRYPGRIYGEPMSSSPEQLLLSGRGCRPALCAWPVRVRPSSRIARMLCPLCISPDDSRETCAE